MQEQEDGGTKGKITCEAHSCADHMEIEEGTVLFGASKSRHWTLEMTLSRDGLLDRLPSTRAPTKKKLTCRWTLRQSLYIGYIINCDSTVRNRRIIVRFLSHKNHSYG